jgi:KDEL-tailed cysteine endopeptidase
MEKATCCADKEHCCPEDMPVCDTDEGRCLPKQGVNFGKSVPWSSKVPATRKDPAAVVSSFFRPSSSKGQQKQHISPVAVE